MSDLISRQAAIKAIEDLQDCYNGFSDTYDKACIIGVIEEVPTIEAVPLEDYRSMEQTVHKLTQALAEAEPIKHGRWKETEYSAYDDSYRCSACGEVWEFIKGTPKDNGANYCPNCGARMDEVENGKTY